LPEDALLSRTLARRAWCASLFLAGAACAAAPVMAAAAAAAHPAAQPAHVVVDTGHTPKRPGATGASGRVEYLYNLDLTNAIARELTLRGVRVSRVAADGKEIALTERATRVPGADFFLSVHHDSMQQHYIDAGRQREFAGFAIFVSTRNPRYEESLRCARAIGEQLLAAGEKPSEYHAEPIEGENRPFVDRRLGIHRYDGLAVLRTAPMAAVLVEAGVIVNPDEEARLARPDTIETLAGAVAQGAAACVAQ